MHRLAPASWRRASRRGPVSVDRADAVDRRRPRRFHRSTSTRRRCQGGRGRVAQSRRGAWPAARRLIDSVGVCAVTDCHRDCRHAGLEANGQTALVLTGPGPARARERDKVVGRHVTSRPDGDEGMQAGEDPGDAELRPSERAHSVEPPIGRHFAVASSVQPFDQIIRPGCRRAHRRMLTVR